MPIPAKFVKEGTTPMTPNNLHVLFAWLMHNAWVAIRLLSIVASGEAAINPQLSIHVLVQMHARKIDLKSS